MFQKLLILSVWQLLILVLPKLEYKELQILLLQKEICTLLMMFCFLECKAFSLRQLYILENEIYFFCCSEEKIIVNESYCYSCQKKNRHIISYNSIQFVHFHWSAYKKMNPFAKLSHYPPSHDR